VKVVFVHFYRIILSVSSTHTGTQRITCYARAVLRFNSGQKGFTGISQDDRMRQLPKPVKYTTDIIALTLHSKQKQIVNIIAV